MYRMRMIIFIYFFILILFNLQHVLIELRIYHYDKKYLLYMSIYCSKLDKTKVTTKTERFIKNDIYFLNYSNSITGDTRR